MDALLHPTTMEGLMDVAPSSGQRFEAEVAYGFPAHNDRLTVTPAVVLAFSPTSRTYSLLWSVAPHAHQTQGEPYGTARSFPQAHLLHIVLRRGGRWRTHRNSTEGPAPF